MNDPAQPPGVAAMRGSRIAVGCIGAFMVPFFGAGLMLLVQAWRELQRGAPVQSIVVLLGSGCLFCGVALTIVAVAIWGTRVAASQLALRTSNPETPWHWRPDWVAGVIKENRVGQALFLWPFAIFWNAVSLPVWFVMSRELAKQNRAVLITLIFPIVGVGLIAAAIYATARRAKFGASTCTVDRIPLQPGATFYGELRLHSQQRPEAGFRFVLTSIRAITTGSGKSRSTRENVLWQETRVVSASTAAESPDGMRVPFSFELPPDAESTDERQTDNRVLWRLEASAELPGVDYYAIFELPVFRTGHDAELEAKVATYRLAHREEFVRRELPPDSQVTIEPLPSGGFEFRIRPRRDFGSIAGSMLFLIIWCGAIALMLKLDAPIVFPIFFAFFALLILLGMIDAFFGRSVVTAERAGLSIRRSWLGRGTTTNVAASDIESIVVKPIGSATKPVYDVEVRLRTRPVPKTLGCYLKEKDDAEIVAARMWRAVGRE
ncbi:MAG: hypothetical protein JWO97_3677 [Acidobacteria bacterium]|nr:hypothetical protein [Acidobacteriota bacterium]